MGAPPLGRGDTVGGLGGFRDISTEEVEHGQSVHCDMTNYGTIQSVNEEVEVYGLKKVVGTGGVGTGGGAGGGSAGGGNRHGGRRGGRGLTGN